MKIKDIVCMGFDLALNHAGFVELTNGELSNFWYFTTKVGAANRSKEHGTRMILPKTKDKQLLSVARLAWIEKFIKNKVLKNHPDVIGIEDYALQAKFSTVGLGEIGGIARILCYNSGIPFRLHDPLSVKMFATHDGTAGKDYMQEQVLERWGISFFKYDQPAPKKTSKKPNPKRDRTVSEDLTDAFAIAQLVWTEYQLRHGMIQLSDLHPKEIQVFIRITKKYPVNLLGRDWISEIF